MRPPHCSPTKLSTTVVVLFCCQLHSDGLISKSTRLNRTRAPNSKPPQREFQSSLSNPEMGFTEYFSFPRCYCHNTHPNRCFRTQYQISNGINTMMPSNRLFTVAQSRPSSRVGSKGQRRLLLSVRLLIKILQGTGRREDQLLVIKIKAAVKDCVRRNRAGDSTAFPLQEILECRLKAVVGPQMFAEALFLVDSFQAKRRLRRD
jgi:hypothetical protein